MHREVFDGRHGFMTVGEAPGATIEQARLVTDPARRELDMVFQFEHVSLDHADGKFRPRELEPGELAASFTTWQDARLFAAAAGAAAYSWRRDVLVTIVAGMAVYLPLHIGLGW